MMNERDWLVERFEEHRPHLRAVAYRMLGSLAEADEAVQDAWVRVSRAGNLSGQLQQHIRAFARDLPRAGRDQGL